MSSSYVNGLSGYCAQHPHKQRFSNKAMARAHLLTREKEFRERVRPFKCKSCRGVHFSSMERGLAQAIDRESRERRYGIKNWRAFEALIPEKERLESITPPPHKLVPEPGKLLVSVFTRKGKVKTAFVEPGTGKSFWAQSNQEGSAAKHLRAKIKAYQWSEEGRNDLFWRYIDGAHVHFVFSTVREETSPRKRNFTTV